MIDQSAGYLFPPGEPLSFSKINGCYGLPDLNADGNVLEGMARKPTHHKQAPGQPEEEFLVWLSRKKRITLSEPQPLPH